MSWTDLILTASWVNRDGYPVLRVRQLTGMAQLEGYLSYQGGFASPISTAPLPAGCYDTLLPHTLGGRCYDISGTFLGSCEIVVGTDGSVSVGWMPNSTWYLHFGGIYPTM